LTKKKSQKLYMSPGRAHVERECDGILTICLGVKVNIIMPWKIRFDNSLNIKNINFYKKYFYILRHRIFDFII